MIIGHAPLSRYEQKKRKIERKTNSKAKT